MVSQNPPVPVGADQEVVPDPKKPYKTYAAGLATVVVYVAFAWFFDETPKKAPEFTRAELEDAIWQGLLASGLVAIPTFVKKNPLKVQRRNKHEA
jgi:hypothetical protein